MPAVIVATPMMSRGPSVSPSSRAAIATPLAFFSTTILLGGMAVSALLLMILYLGSLRKDSDLPILRQIIQRTLVWVMLVAIIATVIELGTYAFQIADLRNQGVSGRASLDLLLDLYRVLFGVRIGLLLYGVIALVVMVLRQRATRKPIVQLLTPVYFTFLIVLVGEVLGRFLFYAIHIRTGL